MFTYEFIVAAAVITAPPDAEAAADMRAWHMPLRASLIQVALQAEIMDRREDAFHFIAMEKFGPDLAMIQSRFIEFQGAPLLEECNRFPDRKLIADFLAFNRSYRTDLCARLAIDPVHAEDLRNAIHETDQLYNAWNALRDARCDYYYVTVRRESLTLLRQLAGNESFYSGQMPPHVPVWRFASR